MKKISIGLLWTTIALCWLFLSPASGGVDWQEQPGFVVDGQPLDIAGPVDDNWVLVLVKGFVKIYDSGGKVRGIIPVLPEMDRLTVSGSGAVMVLTSSTTSVAQKKNLNFPRQINIAGSPFKGREDAAVTIVVFSDFQCPFCAHAGPLVDKILAQNPETVKIVFKNYPLKQHQYAYQAALAAMAAHSQGKFWEFHDLLFQNNQNITDDLIQSIIKSLGLDLSKFLFDIENITIRQQVEQDKKDGDAAGVAGTPTIFINGREIKKGTFIQKIIDEELALAATNAELP